MNKPKIGDVIEYTNESGMGFDRAIGSVGLVVGLHDNKAFSIVRWISRTCPKWVSREDGKETVSNYNVRVIGHVDPKEMEI